MKLINPVEYQASLFVFDFKSNILQVSFNDTCIINRDIANAMYLQVDYLYLIFLGYGING